MTNQCDHSSRRLLQFLRKINNYNNFTNLIKIVEIVMKKTSLVKISKLQGGWFYATIIRIYYTGIGGGGYGFCRD